MIQLLRLSDKPVLTPRKDLPWEASAVFNCGAVADNNLIHLIYRATDIASDGSEGAYISRLGYAVSTDGLTFNRLEHPILSNDIDQELRGPEDPRLVKIDDTFYMTYTAYGGRFEGDYRISLASSMNLTDWKRHGVLLDETNKDAALFPEKIDGQYLMLHRRPPDIWFAYSDDLLHWHEHQRIMRPLPESPWECLKIGAAGPPFKTAHGWILIYHGVSADRHYSLGIALLDLEDPSKVVARQRQPILEPKMEWERNGHVPNVVFSCGQVIHGDELYVYYGGADTVVGVASVKTEALGNI
jgi:predicted GH43/DUF377 family glycosyl hydrolase